MIRLLVIFALVAHGLIHALGFAKAFGLADLPNLTMEISRPWGIVWGVCALAIAAATIAYAAHAPWWWMLAAPALIASQIVVITFWTDAKYGTVANLVLILPVLAAFGSWRFAGLTRAEIASLAARVPPSTPGVIALPEAPVLPKVVATWLARSGVVGQTSTSTLYLKQRGELQTAPGDDWMRFRAEQWVLVDEPAFVWAAHVDGRFGIDMAGLDQYVGAKGSMRIKLFALIPVVDESGPTIDQGALVRFLAEIMWYPSAALEPYIRWEAIDQASARATVRDGDLEVTGVFHFTADGDVLGFEAKRYRSDKLEDWIIKNDPESFENHAGTRIPTRSTITWRNDAGVLWTWLRLEVLSLERNIPLTGE